MYVTTDNIIFFCLGGLMMLFSIFLNDSIKDIRLDLEVKKNAIERSKEKKL